MNNDLISREDLKKQITDLFEEEEKIDKKWAMGLKYSLKIISAAPAVEDPQIMIPVATITFDDEKLKELTDNIVEQIKSGELVLKTEKIPKGKKIANNDANFDDNVAPFFCSECLMGVHINYNFCWFCGADLRGDNNVDK